MKAIGNSLPFVVLLVGVIAMVGLVRMQEGPKQAESIKRNALVDVVSVQRCDEGFPITIDGEVITYRETTLAAQVGGQITKKAKNARAGSYIREGDVLFEIDPRNYELEVRRLQETVKQANSNIEEADVEKTTVERIIEIANGDLSLKQAEVQRFEKLQDRNAISVSQLEKSRQAELQALNQLETQKNRVTMIDARRNRLLQQKEQAMTNLDISMLSLERTQVKSSFDGVVIQDFAEQDDFVQPGSRLVQIEDNSKVEVRFSLRMDQLRWLWNSAAESKGLADSKLAEPNPAAPSPSAAAGYTFELPKLPIIVRVDVDGNHFQWPAKLDRYDGAGIDPRTRTIPVIAVVDDPTAVQLDKDADALPLAAPPTLLRGSYVTIQLVVGEEMPLLRIPATSYRPNKTVWIFEREQENKDGSYDGKLRIVPIKVAHGDEHQIIIMANTATLKPDDQIVVSPLPVSENGMAVRTAATKSPPPTAAPAAKKEGA